jgi:hypothetical protein
MTRRTSGHGTAHRDERITGAHSGRITPGRIVALARRGPRRQLSSGWGGALQKAATADVNVQAKVSAAIQ